MFQSKRSFMRIGCPRCESNVQASVPPGSGVVNPEDDGGDRLRGKEAYCGSCGHELELYYF